MDARTFEAIVKTVPDMTPTQCDCLASTARSHRGQTVTTDVINAQGEEKFSKCCPHCKSTRVGGWGSANGLRRWRCKACKKTFTGLTGNPLVRHRKRAIWLQYVDLMFNSVPESLRSIAAILGISTTTAFHWRHALLENLADGNDPVSSGICEFDETFVVESRKGSREWVRWERHLPGAVEPDRDPRRRKGKSSKRGLSKDQVPILVGRDRTGRTNLTILTGLSFKHIAPVLAAIVSPDSIICSDGAGCYKKFGKVHNFTVVQMNSKKKIFTRNKVHHIQNSNSCQSRFKDFMRPFRGPATKNLKKYLGWFFWRETLGHEATPEKMFGLALKAVCA